MDPRTGAALRRAATRTIRTSPTRSPGGGWPRSTSSWPLTAATKTLRGLGADPSRLVLLRSFDPSAGAATERRRTPITATTPG